MIERKTISVGEAAERYGMSRSTINRLIRHRLVPSSKVLGRRLIDLAAFDRLVAGANDDPEPSPDRKGDANRDRRARLVTNG